MSPHLVTAPADEAYQSPESRLAGVDPSRATMIDEFAHARLRAAESSADATAQALAAHSERKAARARLALVSGWTRAAQHSRNADSLVSRVEIHGISIPRP
jgi:hypothetical protein